MTDLAEEYGKGLYDLTEEEHISEDVLAQLRVLRGLFRDQPDFIRLLCNMSLAKEERTAILDGALRGQVHPYVLNFLKILCERGALHEFEGCVSAFAALDGKGHTDMVAIEILVAVLDDFGVGLELFDHYYVLL